MKYFIITGASKGLGEGIALELLDENHTLLCIARGSSEKLRQLAAAKNCRVRFFNYDLSDHTGINPLMDNIFKQIQGEQSEGIYLVNNAGTVKPVARVEDYDAEAVKTHLHLNLLAPMLLSAAFIRLTKDVSCTKRILNISSGAAQNPYYGWGCYCTGKAGVDMFGRCISEEQQGEPNPVETMGVAPGIIDTDMQTAIRSTDERAFIHKQKFVDLKESGQLIAPAIAGKKLAKLLLSDLFKDGTITDIRDTY